jgi:hypothetical protein
MEPAPVEKPVTTSRFGWFPRWLTRPSLVVGFLLTPLMAVSLTLAFCKATLLDCTPLLSDEIHYWNEIAAFARAGFNGGYFVPNEHPAAISFFHFGPHGPAFPVLYGIPAALFGWYRASGPLFNVFALMAGAGVWIWRCRPDNTRLATGMLLLATFWPCLMYLPCTMQESLHLAVAFVLAALAHPLVNNKSRPDNYAEAGEVTPSGKNPSPWLFMLVVAAVSLIRFTWLLVLIPWISIALASRSWRTRLLLVLVIACLIPSIFFLARQICAPYPNYASKLLAFALKNPSHAYAEFKQRGQQSFEKFTSPTMGTTLEILQHFQVIGLVLVACLVILRPGPRDTRPYAFGALNLILIAGMMIAFYDVGEFRDYRVVAPHLLLCLLVLLSGEGYRWAIAVAFVNLLFLAPFLGHFESTNRDRFAVQGTVLDNDRAKLAGYLAYDPTKSAWDNTVLISDQTRVYQMVAIPPGMGVSFILGNGEAPLMNGDAPPMTYPIKSRYVFMQSSLVKKFIRDRVHLRPLVDTDVETLYLNLDRLPEKEPQ